MKYLNSANRLSCSQEVLFTLIDVSGSMDSKDYHPSRRLGAIEANRRLMEVKAKRFPDDQMAVIAFDDKAYLLQPPTTLGLGLDSLIDSLQKNVSEGYGTNFVPAMEMAERHLSHYQPPAMKKRGLLSKVFREVFLEADKSKPQADAMVTKRIILLTDGGHGGRKSPAKIADRLKNAGVILECIGIAGYRDDVDEERLKKIASRDESGQPRYTFIGDTASLIQKYQSMANHIRPV